MDNLGVVDQQNIKQSTKGVINHKNFNHLIWSATDHQNSSSRTKVRLISKNSINKYGVQLIKRI